MAITNVELTSPKEIRMLEQWKTAETKVWAKSAYSNTEVLIGNPLAAEDSAVKVVWIEPKDTQMEQSIQKMFKNKFPELADSKEELEVLA